MTNFKIYLFFDRFNFVCFQTPVSALKHHVQGHFQCSSTFVWQIPLLSIYERNTFKPDILSVKTEFAWEGQGQREV